MDLPISVALSRYLSQNVLVIVVPETQGMISSVEIEGKLILNSSFKCSQEHYRLNVFLPQGSAEFVIVHILL